MAYLTWQNLCISGGAAALLSVVFLDAESIRSALSKIEYILFGAAVFLKRGMVLDDKTWLVWGLFLLIYFMDEANSKRIKANHQVPVTRKRKGRR